QATKGQPPLEGADGTIDDLKLALLENLENRGVLRKLKAQVRAEIIRTLEGPQSGVSFPTLCNDNLLINELVRDYLEYNGYSNALSVFVVESGQPTNHELNRDFLKEQLGLTERRGESGPHKPPLLYGILHALRRREEASSAEGPREHDQGD
ncbi:unnamed protein product, partial [Ascophyllum nodosum]